MGKYKERGISGRWGRRTYREDKALMRRMRKIDPRRGKIRLSRRILQSLGPWNYLMMRELDEKIRKPLKLAEIVGNYSGQEICAKKILKIYEMSVRYKRLAELDYKPKRK